MDENWGSPILGNLRIYIYLYIYVCMYIYMFWERGRMVNHAMECGPQHVQIKFVQHNHRYLCTPERINVNWTHMILK